MFFWSIQKIWWVTGSDFEATGFKNRILESGCEDKKPRVLKRHSERFRGICVGNVTSSHAFLREKFSGETWLSIPGVVSRSLGKWSLHFFFFLTTLPANPRDVSTFPPLGRVVPIICVQHFARRPFARETSLLRGLTNLLYLSLTNWDDEHGWFFGRKHEMFKSQNCSYLEDHPS